jgi:hypothetical protein
LITNGINTSGEKRFIEWKIFLKDRDDGRIVDILLRLVIPEGDCRIRMGE